MLNTPYLRAFQMVKGEMGEIFFLSYPEKS